MSSSFKLKDMILEAEEENKTAFGHEEKLVHRKGAA